LCAEALCIMRTFIPPDVANRTKAELTACGLPPILANRLVQKKQLWLIVMHPEDTAKLHHADLANKYAVTGTDIVELRAIFAMLPSSFQNDPEGKKEEWRKGVRDKLKEMTRKEQAGQLIPNEVRHSAYRHESSASSKVKRGVGGEEECWVGPFNPSSALIRIKAIESSAFDSTPQPAATIDQQQGGLRVKDLQAMIQQQQGRVGSAAGCEGGQRKDLEARQHVS